MKRKTLFIIGIALVLGAVLAAVAMAQNTANKPTGNHECTPEMMENMAPKNASGYMTKNCAPEIMASEDCENMTDTAMAGCSSMAVNLTVNQTESNHCSNMDSSMSSMMRASVTQKVMA